MARINGANFWRATIIRQILGHIGPTCELVHAAEREWASATFAGARHIISLRLLLTPADAPAPAALAALPDHEFRLCGEIVADCTVSHGARESAGAGSAWLPCQVELLTINAD